MNHHYDNRNVNASPFTAFVIDELPACAHSDRVLGKMEFLKEIEKRAKKRAAMARALDLAPARITEMFKGERDLSYDEAVRLANAFGMEAPVPPKAPEMNEQVARLVVRWSAEALGASVAPDEPRVEEIARAVLAFARFASDPTVSASKDALEGFLRGRLSVVEPPQSASEAS